MDGKAAIAAGHDVLAANEMRITPNTLRDEFGMFNVIGLAFDNARDQHLALGQFHMLKNFKFMGMARVCRFKLNGMSGAAAARIAYEPKEG